jgi:hypothetical protein
MTDDEEKAEELLQASTEKERTNTEAASIESDTDDSVDRTQAIKEALLSIEGGDVPENINVRDARLKALLVGLEEADELGDVGEDLAAAAGVDDADVSTQSDVARLLMRAGLREVLPEVLDDATEARQRAVLEQTDDF